MPNKKISELPASTALTGAELTEVVQGGVNKQTTTQAIANLGGGGGAWGGITGTLSDQTDLQSALDAKLAALITANRQTASYTLVLADATKLVEMNVAGVNDLTVPLNSSVAFPVGTQLLIAQYGAGQTTIVATGGVTIRSAGGALKFRAQYSQATLIKIATDEWYAGGDLTTV